MLLPWATRTDRAAAVEQARRQKETSQAGAAAAAAIERDIRRMAAQNGFAQLIATQIMRDMRHRGDGAV